MSGLPIALLIFLTIAILLRMDLLFYLVYVLTGIYALARWWAGRTLPRMQFCRRFTEHIFAGETVKVEIEVHNTGWWPVPWLRYEETAPALLSTGSSIRQVISLRPREQTRLQYELIGQRRGYYEIGPGTARTGDLFGFAEAQVIVGAGQYLTVYPRIIPLMHVDLDSRSPLGTVKSQQRIFVDPARVIGVRDYVSGDPLRAIDWKSSARVGHLQVKKRESAVSMTTVIFLELNPNAYARQLRAEASEWAIVVAASLARYLVGERQAVGLASNGVDVPTGACSWTIPPRPGRLHLIKLLERLARVQLVEGPSLAAWLPVATADLPWGTTVVVVAPSGDEAMCSALHRLRRAGLNPVLVAVEPHAHFAIVQERCRRLGVAAHLAADEHDLKRWQSGTWMRPA